MPGVFFLLKLIAFVLILIAQLWDLPGSPVVETLTSSVGDVGSIPGLETKGNMPQNN